MLTGRQIREARRLLHWDRPEFGRRVAIAQTVVAAIESSDGAAWLSAGQEGAIRSAFDAAGVEFTADGARSKVKP